MVRISKVEKNPRCIASVTIRAKRVKRNTSTMRIDNQPRKILGIIHRPSERINDE